METLISVLFISNFDFGSENNFLRKILYTLGLINALNVLLSALLSICCCWCSVDQLCLFVPHGLQHAWLPCPSPSPGACSNSCPLSWWCHPTISSSVIPFSSCLQSFPASGFFPNYLAFHIRWPKHWSFSFSISPSNEYSGLISFRIDWVDLFAVQGTLKSLLQHHSSKASIL